MKKTLVLLAALLLPFAAAAHGPTPLKSVETVTIKAGTKVIWKWTGTNPHSIQLSGTTSPEQTSGTYERTFDQRGSSFNYQCGVHKAAMAGKIVIE